MNNHKTVVYKKRLPGGKSHPEWRGGKTPANINVHQGKNLNLMAQKAKFQKTILKQMSKFSEKKKKKKKKKRCHQRYSDSDSSDSA